MAGGATARGRSGGRHTGPELAEDRWTARGRAGLGGCVGARWCMQARGGSGKAGELAAAQGEAGGSDGRRAASWREKGGHYGLFTCGRE